MLRELLLQFGGSVEGLPALLLRQPLVHLPVGTNSQTAERNWDQNWDQTLSNPGVEKLFTGGPQWALKCDREAEPGAEDSLF